MWGSCSGGMTLAAYLGWLAAPGERKVVNTTWAVCVLDTDAALEDSTLGLFNTPAAIRARQGALAASRGSSTGPEMARMFAWMRPNDLIWNYWVNNYLLGNKPPAFDILFWNDDTTRLPAPVPRRPARRSSRTTRSSMPAPCGSAGCRSTCARWRSAPTSSAASPTTSRRGTACYGTARLLRPRIDLRARQRRAPAEPGQPAGRAEVVLLRRRPRPRSRTTGPRPRRPAAPTAAGGRTGAPGSRSARASWSTRPRSSARPSTHRSARHRARTSTRDEPGQRCR